MHKILLSVFLIVKLSFCQRRITNGTSVEHGADTSFVVYIIGRIPETDGKNSVPAWTCGGCIIHPSLVLTSASCLRTGDSEKYIVSGYRKYVNSKDATKDKCLSSKDVLRKIVSYCVPKDSGTIVQKTEDEKKYLWTKYDIAIARTNLPIDFYNTDYLKYCSYRPSAVNVNFMSKYEDKAGVVVYGWGHATHYRPDGDERDYNEPTLRYASSIVLPRLECMDYFDNQYIKDRIGNHYICTSGAKGEFDSRGKHWKHTKPIREKCSRRAGSFGSNRNETVCSSDENSNETESKNYTIDAVNLGATRRHGICQNDHGSPLVLWVGGHPYVVGVASAFQVNKQMECVGPYLYTSVMCTSLFINCVLHEQNTIKSRRAKTICDGTDAEKGYKVEETVIDWSDEDF